MTLHKFKYPKTQKDQGNSSLTVVRGKVHFRIGPRGEDLGTKKFLGSEEARRKLWEHTAKVADVECIPFGAC
jgi:hypothetical protein